MIKVLLEKLIKTCNKPSTLIERQQFNITPKRHASYHALSVSERIQFHQELELVCTKTNALKVTYAPKAFGEDDLIESILITDSRKLCHFLNIAILSELTNTAVKALESIRGSCPSWFSEILDEIQLGWLEGRKPYRCSIAAHEKLKDSATFIAWLESIDLSQLCSSDVRTVSVKLYNDSKKLESLAPLIKLLMAKQLPQEVQSLAAMELLSYLGVSKFPPLFRLKGDVTVRFKAGEVSMKHCWPNIGISPDGVENIVLNQTPDYVLFIENQTTFERYCREVNDNGLILYTNGFPSKSWQSIFTKIEYSLPPSTELYHWGDIDIGGYKILSFMDSLFIRNVIPYMMNPMVLTGISSEKSICRNSLIECLSNVKDGPVKELRDSLLSSNNPSFPWIEQELLEVNAISKINSHSEKLDT